MPATSALLALAFIQSIGLNTHLSWQDTAYGDFPKVQRELAWLGVSHVRDSVPPAYMLPKYQALAAAGIKFDLVISGNNAEVDIPANLARIDALVRLSPGSVLSIEGPNELNAPDNKVTFNGRTATDPEIGADIMQSLYRAVRADPTLSGVHVINLSLSNGIHSWRNYLRGLGNVSAHVDRGNWHVYFNNGHQPADVLREMIPYARQSAPGRPVTITEAGYFTAWADRSGWGGVDEPTQAKLTLNLLADAFQMGVTHTYLYELMEHVPHPADTDIENTFGLFRADGTPKPAATAIHNLTAILKQRGPEHAGPAAEDPSYRITGLPAQGHSLLLTKSSGAYDLLLWSEPPVWDGHSRKPIPIAPVKVTISFGMPYRKLAVFDPIRSDDPIQTATDARDVSVELADRMLVIEIANPTGARE